MSAYVTIAGDTWDGISRKKFGIETKAALIAAANPGVSEPISAGTVLIVPGAPSTAASISLNSDSDELSLSVGGERFRYWTQVSLTDSIDVMNAVEFQAPFDPSNLAIRRAFKPMSFQEMEVFLGDATMFTGNILSPVPEVEPSSSMFGVGAYARAGVLLDCHPSVGSLPLSYRDQNLEEIAGDLCGPFGVTPVFGASPGTPFRKVQISPMQKVFKTLVDLAAQRNFLITSDGLGQLVFHQPPETGPSVASLHGESTPVLEVKPAFNPQNYFSHVTGFRGTKTGRLGASHTIKNFFMDGALRPFNFEADDVKRGELQSAVESKVGRMFGNFVSYNIRLNTWIDPSGFLWTPGTFLTLEAPRAMIYNPYLFLIRAVQLLKTKDSKTAVLSLVLPGSFTGVVPESLPWD